MTGCRNLEFEEKHYNHIGQRNKKKPHTFCARFWMEDPPSRPKKPEFVGLFGSRVMKRAGTCSAGNLASFAPLCSWNQKCKWRNLPDKVPLLLLWVWIPLASSGLLRVRTRKTVSDWPARVPRLHRRARDGCRNRYSAVVSSDETYGWGRLYPGCFKLHF